MISLKALTGTHVLVTGHTGFKGSWLAMWLSHLGCAVHGYSLPPPTTPNLFEAARVRVSLASHQEGDVRDIDQLTRVVRDVYPDIVFHLAAQSLVRTGYDDPIATFGTNVMGTANLCEALRTLNRQCVVIIVTSDKCYEDNGNSHPETDALGGRDPYSASKAAAEMVAGAYGHSFFTQSGIQLATVRAGNVIGGGDWAHDRIVPDLVRAARSGDPIRLRNPHATRPWQYVLDPIYGYMLLAARMREGGLSHPSAWNFGPPHQEGRTVEALTTRFLSLWGYGSYVIDTAEHPLEQPVLSIDSNKAARLLGWKSHIDFDDAFARTVHWYKLHAHGVDMAAVSAQEIKSYAMRAA